jgi:RNA polymerase sigma-70 factor (ECF subfamily)
MPVQPSDEELAIQVGQEDLEIATAAFNRLLERHRDRIEQIVRRVIHPVIKQDVEDVTQEVLIRLWEALHDRRGGGFDSTRSFWPWIAKMARNLAIDYQRRFSYRRHRSLADEETTEAVESQLAAISREKSPDEIAASKEDAQSLLARLARLPEVSRPIVELWAQGLTHKEIAERLGLPEGTVASRLSRARAQLREHLGHDNEP